MTVPAYFNDSQRQAGWLLFRRRFCLSERVIVIIIIIIITILSIIIIIISVIIIIISVIIIIIIIIIFFVIISIIFVIFFTPKNVFFAFFSCLLVSSAPPNFSVRMRVAPFEWSLTHGESAITCKGYNVIFGY